VVYICKINKLLIFKNMNPCEMAWEIECIKQLKARYFRFMDLRDWDNLSQTMSLDIVFEHPTIGLHRSRSSVLAALKFRLERLKFTSHHGTMSEIQIHSRTEASGIWSLHSSVIPKDGANKDSNSLIIGHGRYFDQYRNEDGQWRISALRLDHLYKSN
jgi:hypothetical protein